MENLVRRPKPVSIKTDFKHFMHHHSFNLVYVGVFLLYSFFTLPLLLPKINQEVPKGNYDAIIVLGGGVDKNCTLGHSMQSRMNTAIELYKKRKAKRIIVSGGITDESTCAEAEAMRQYAAQQGIPTKAIIKESLAQNTYQNAFYSVGIMQQHNMKKAIVVTSSFHAKRAQVIFQKYAIQSITYPAKNKFDGLYKYIQLFREQLLLCFHTVFGVPNQFGLAQNEGPLASIS